MKGKAFILSVFTLAAALYIGLSCGAAFADEAATAETVPGAASETRIPRLEASPDNFDFGTIDEGEKPMAVFTLKNAGGSELVIYDAKPSCGCTLATLSSKRLMPGETAKLEAVYNSTNSRGGKISKYVTVKTNDPREPSKVLRITGEVKAKPAPILTLSQYSVGSLNLPPGEVEKRRVQMSNAGQEDLVITQIDATKGISARVGKYEIARDSTVKMQLVLKPGELADMDIEIAPVAGADGRFAEKLVIRSNSKARPATQYVASGVVQ